MKYVSQVPTDHPIWKKIGELFSAPIPDSLKATATGNPSLLSLINEGDWTQAAQPGGIIHLLRETINDLQLVTVDEESESVASAIYSTRQKLEQPGIDINYIGAASFLVEQFALEEEREIINALRIPMLRAEMARKLQSYRDTPGWDNERTKETLTQWLPELEAKKVLGVQEEFAFNLLKELSIQTNLPSKSKFQVAAKKATILLNAYLQANKVPFVVSEVARKVWFGMVEDRTPMEELLFEINGKVHKIIFDYRNDFLRVLHAVSRIFAAKYQWAPSVCIPFILCGARPGKKVARVTYDIREDIPCCSRIILEIDPVLTADDVYRIYKNALNNIGGAKRKKLSRKHLSLACVCKQWWLSEEFGGDWDFAMDQWNGLATGIYNLSNKILYSNVSIFRRDCEVAYQRLMFPKWKQPKSNSEYPRIDWGSWAPAPKPKDISKYES